MKVTEVKIITLSILISVFLFGSSAALAQTEEASVQDRVQIEAQTGSATELSSEDITLPVLEKVPSGAGLWWRGVKEKVSLAVTRDPVKKAEKQLKFAEERLQIAQTIAEKSTDPKVQARAEAMVVKANEYLQRIEDKKDAWMAKNDEKSATLLKNIATHELRREKIIEHLEEKLPEGTVQKIRVHQDKALEGSRRLLNAIDKEKVPESVRAHLQSVKERIEMHAVEAKLFQQKAAELRTKVQAGDEAAKQQLENLRADTKEKVEEADRQAAVERMRRHYQPPEVKDNQADRVELKAEVRPNKPMPKPAPRPAPGATQ